MGALLDAFWRAAAYCLHPRVIALSVLPLVLMVAGALALGYFFWEGAVDTVGNTIDSWQLPPTFLWMDSVGLGGLRTVLAPLVVVFAATPVIVVVALLIVALLMTPAIVSLVAERRFPTLDRRRGGSFFSGVLWAVGTAAFALLAIAASIPLWFVPPLVLVLPPLIWGWLTYRVMSYDVLSEHASADERRTLIQRHRGPLLAIGVLSGYLGAAPSIVWASGVFFLAFAPVLIPVAIWIYTLVFAFSALWFAHFLLSALYKLRGEVEVLPAAPVPSRSAGAGAPGQRDLRDLRDLDDTARATDMNTAPPASGRPELPGPTSTPSPASNPP
jgi:hypothetical protein